MQSAAGVRQEVSWTPTGQHFITWGSDISLYDLAPRHHLATRPSSIILSDKTEAHLVASNSSYHYVKCVDICPQPQNDPLLALGLSNGKVVLTTFGPSTFDALGLNGKEFIPRHARQCNGVAWNPIDSNLLAGVLDKYRNDHCILLWDVTRCHNTDGNMSPRSCNMISQHSSNLTPAVELAKPLAEMSLSEHAHSLAWLHRQPSTLIVGMNQKQIKIYDLRDIVNKSVTTVNTKAVYGVCVDPYNDYQLASRADNTILTWDRRMFEKPVLTLQQVKAVTKISWCPTRQNLLGSLQRDSTFIHLSDIRGLGTEDEFIGEMGGDLPTALERSVSPGLTHTITSFSWHPTDNNRLLTISMPGTLVDYTVCERITLNWGSGVGPFVWSHGNTSLKMLSEHSNLILDDISAKIKQRATTDYGLVSELWMNGDLANDNELKKLWYWLSISRSLVEDGCIRGTYSKYPGIKSILKLDLANVTNNAGSYVQQVKFDCINSSVHMTYRSDEREKALQLCGWNFDKDTAAFTSFLDKLESEKAYTRAAAIAVFHMKLRAAIDILNRGAEKCPQFANLGIISMAISGYSESPGSMWRQLCSTPRYLSDPYIRAIFAFLTAENDTYENVLNENGMSVEDKVAFACMFLSDSKLNEFVVQITNKLVIDGNLSGIILTGINAECINLLQQYLDTTCDVQSVSLIAARTFSPEVLKEPPVSDWIASYRNLLDSWHFWAQRAVFDIILNAHNQNNKPANQIYVSCNYCGKSVSAYMQGLNRTNRTFARIGVTTSKFKQMSACPNCRKPLPRCSICLLHMGAHGAPVNVPTSSNNRDSHKTNGDVSCWFTWCQSCRHGGHSVHMVQWFKDHTECPVTSCTCQCFTADTVSSHSFLQTCVG